MTTTGRTRSRTTRLVTVALGVLAATTCSAFVSGTASAAETAPAGLERYYHQHLAWGPCTPFAYSRQERQTFPDPRLECARLDVPLDYAKPDGRTAQIAVLRHRTTWPKIGSLVLNPGGPGGSGLDYAADYARSHGDMPFDIVGFDPRGIGASVPAVRCLIPDDSSGATGATDPVVQQETLLRDEIRGCERGSGGDDVLANIGTRDVARDLDVLRAALGDRTLTYLGASYGTLIGTTYAEMFPQNVRAFVLDGVWDGSQTVVERTVAQAAAFQHAFDTYAADCTRRPDCPLGRDPRATTAAYQALTRPLITKPLPVGDGRSVYYRTITSLTDGAMYNPASWPALTRALTALKAHDGKPILALADGSAPGFDGDAFTAVHCADDDRITDRAVMAQLRKKVAAVKPYADSGVPQPAALEACGLWPVPPTSTPHLPHADGLPTTLVISTTGDPATPYAAGVRIADALDAQLLTVEGTQHTASGAGNRCVDQIVSTYLATLDLPGDGARCVISPDPAAGA